MRWTAVAEAAHEDERSQWLCRGRSASRFAASDGASSDDGGSMRIATRTLLLGCAILFAFCVRWWVLMKEDRAYVHTRRQTVQIAVQSRPGGTYLWVKRRSDAMIAFSGLPPTENDQKLGLIRFYRDGTYPPAPWGLSPESHWNFGDFIGDFTHAPWHGFAYGSGDDPYATPGTPVMRCWVLAVPLWFVTAISATPPLIWLTSRVMSRRRRKAGRCPTCGYDLRATPSRCPECGGVPNARREPTT